MEYFQKRKLIKELLRLTDEARTFELEHYLGDHEIWQLESFLLWSEEVKHSLEQAFGESSEYMRRFQDLEFGIGGEPVRDLSFESAVEARAILAGAVFRIRTYGLARSSLNAGSLQDDIRGAGQDFSSPRSKWGWIVSIVIVPLLVAVASFVLRGCWDDYRESRKKLYRQIEVDFRNWIEDYDQTLMKGFNALLEDAASRNMLQSGESATESISYFQEYRRKRDNKIDSFLVAYALAGGDTLGLKYQRKLPINVNEIIVYHWGSMDDRMLKHIKSCRLDTL